MHTSKNKNSVDNHTNTVVLEYLANAKGASVWHNVQPNAKIAWLDVVCQGTRELVEYTTHHQVTVKIDGAVGHPYIVV